MKQPLGITLIVPPGQEATGVYEAVGGVEVFMTDTPYTLTDGKSLSPPLPIKIVTGETFTDSMGNSQTALAVSGLTSPPTNTALPTISGTATVGETLTATSGTWSGDPAPTYSYQWQRGAANIAGATGASYTLVSADVGSTVRVVVTATNSAGSASANSASTASVTEAPANTALPAITGIAQVGETLTVSNGTWTGTPAPTYARQWKADGVNIAGATATTYMPVEADVGAIITCTVTATNSAGSASANSSGVGPVEGSELVTPAVLTGVSISDGGGGGTHTWDAETMTMETTVVGTSGVYPRYNFPVGALDPAATYAMNLEAVDTEGRLLRATIALSVNDATGSAAFTNGVLSADVSYPDEQTRMVVMLDGTLIGATTFSTISLKRVS